MGTILDGFLFGTGMLASIAVGTYIIYRYVNRMLVKWEQTDPKHEWYK